MMQRRDSDSPAPRSASGAASKTTGGALGTGLMALGGVVGALIVLWLLVSALTAGLTAGGAVIGLVLVALLALPPIGAGWYLRSRAGVEVEEAATFTERRGVLDSDRVVRRELAREIEQRIAGLLAAAERLPAEPAGRVRTAVTRLRDLAADVSNPAYDSTTWLEQTAAQLDDRAMANIRRYDDLVLEETRRLAALQDDLPRDPGAADRLAEAVETLAGHVREREDLLGRGRAAAALTPQEMLAAGARPRRRLATPLELNLDDAVSYERSDYLVRAIVTYFAGGRSWKAYQLHDGKQERWLEVRANGDDTAWYELTAPPAPNGGDTITLNGTVFAAGERGSATADIDSAAGARQGVFVEYRRYAAPSGTRLVVEHWPDAPRALLGGPVAPEDLQLWTKPPAAG